MLNPEQANAQLQAIRIQDWKEQRVKSIANLPQALRPVGWGILGRDIPVAAQKAYFSRNGVIRSRFKY